MHWELWDIETANLVGTFDSEPAGLAVVRELVGKGWPLSALSLMVEDEAVPTEDLPPGVTGEQLAQRAGLTGPDQTRRTA
jgi:hypothetical protein